MAGFQRVRKRFFIYQAATRAVDDAHALFGFRQGFAREDIASGVG